ncbi:DUF4232 domain-containing protein [Streptomyces hydrogenans]|uniref:DUF4232 domain-containing protein n=1 Tax=Streptomyces hydrogenans TaxID=1873719 RepID=UPI0033266202
MRLSVRTLALPAAALAAALSLTACQSSSDPDAAPAPTSASPRQTTGTDPTAEATPTTAAPDPTRTTAPATAPTKTPPKKTARPTQAPAPSSTPADGAGGDDDARPLRPCTAQDVKVVASKVSRPVNHLALTITNTGGRTCDALGAPLVGFDHSQAPIRIMEKSKPQAVVTLAPGESAYASVLLTGEPGGPGEDTHGMTVRTVKVNLTADSMKTVPAPEGTFVDDGAAVSYWQRELEDALQF